MAILAQIGECPTDIEEYVGIISDEDRHEIIKSYEKFERNCVIGEEPVRIHARAFLEKTGNPDTNITFWMEKLATACYRHYYNQQFK
jgi:hypothetical protein